MMKKIIGLFFFLSVVAAACKKSTFDPGTTTTPKTSNGWWVTYSAGGTVLVGPILFSTYNTAANNTDSMWIDDLKNFWEFKGKVALNYKALTFGSTGIQNNYYPSTADLTNGKILLKGGHSKAGNVTDSIYFQITFSDDTSPGTVYTVAGTARTGLIEDDY